MKKLLRTALIAALGFTSIASVPSATAADCAPAVTSSSAYTILTFSAPGTCTYKLPSTATRVEYLIVGGGGGGGNNAGWGGGGGSYATGQNTLSASQTISVTVGDGGAGGQAVDSALRDGQDGASSGVAFANITVTANGGTGGQTYWSLNTCNSGVFTSTTYSGNGGSGGSPAANTNAAAGGTGYSVTVTPPSGLDASNYQSFAGGGGGGVTGTGNAGLGTHGGGNGGASNVVGNNATSNTGGGGGGGGDQCKNGGKGGSGVVILRYLNSLQTPNLTYSYPSVSGTLVARFVPTDFNGLAKTWYDSSGNGRNLSTYQGSAYTSLVSSGTVANAVSDQYAVTGITSDGLTMPSTVSSTYTVFSVARYTSTTSSLRNRIIANNYYTDTAVNWLQGFYGASGGVTGVAYHGAWITQNSADLNGTIPNVGWVVSASQQNLHRSQGVDRTTGNGNSSSPLIGINLRSGELSNWQVQELIIYSTQLSLSDIQKVEQYLINQYNRGINYSSLSVAAGTNPIYRSTTTITASVRTVSRVTFKVNGKALPNCSRVLSNSSQATCSWKPSIHSQQTISATAVPVSSSYETGTATTSVYVVKRAGSR